ncbi:MAG: hypothetical protein WC539_00130 [Nitrospirota bacterium]
MNNRVVFRIFLAIFLYLIPVSAFGSHPEQPAESQKAAPPEEPLQKFEIEFEPDAYYTNLEFIIPLTSKPVPHLGERSESELYAALLTRSALIPQFIVLEASINPLPYLGTVIRSHAPQFYKDAQVTGSFNWIKSITAGFEEPYAFSILAGNVANFSIPGTSKVTGLGYSGYLVSFGNFHIKENKLIRDDWWEFEWKIKGDRKSPVKKLNWSFRIGTKLHGNPDIMDTVYVSCRRSRVDYQPKEFSLVNNSGFEYTIDLDQRTFSAMRHYITIDKKWPWKKIAFAIALGFLWESSKKYTGALSSGNDTYQFIIRPNIEF